jgi:hypothetical protein
MKKLVLINQSARKFNLAAQGFTVQPLNLAYVAALTPASWEVKIVDENFQPRHFTPAQLFDGIRAFTTHTYSNWRIVGRVLRTLLYSRSLVRALIVFSLNRSLRRRFATGLRPPTRSRSSPKFLPFPSGRSGRRAEESGS